MMKKFFYCGLMGWCIEILFTSFSSFRRRDLRLKGETSIWMFPIYGMGALLLPLFHLLKNKTVWLRGSVYMICIFIIEFTTGCFLKRHKLCPWDYSRARHNIKGVIRLYYAIWWFLTGLLYEKLLTRVHHPHHPQSH